MLLLFNVFAILPRIVRLAMKPLLISFIESYSWIGPGVDETSLIIIKETYGGEPLHGNMLDFLKDKSDKKLKTNYLGAECLTQPNLCENGFSVKFVMKGKI